MSPEDVDLGDSPFEGSKDVRRRPEEDGGLGREVLGGAQERASEAVLSEKSADTVSTRIDACAAPRFTSAEPETAEHFSRGRTGSPD